MSRTARNSRVLAVSSQRPTPAQRVDARLEGLAIRQLGTRFVVDGDRLKALQSLRRHIAEEYPNGRAKEKFLHVLEQMILRRTGNADTPRSRP